jgi:tetratricopeptide (TPR) repeat protein
LWQIVNQKRCHALLKAGRLVEAQEAYRYMTDMSDEATTVCCHDCFIGKSLVFSLVIILTIFTAFEQECAAYISHGDAALSTKDYDKAIELYSAAIGLDSASYTIVASRCNARLGKMLWEDALVDAQRVRWYPVFCKPGSIAVLRSSN